jgi:hypothetical protein
MVHCILGFRFDLVLKLILVISAFTFIGGGQSAAQDTSVPAGASKRFFVSGHSLTDDPYAEYIAAIGKSRGIDMTWNEQIVIGSPILLRTRGESNKPGAWNGYRLGKNRNGSNLDILKEFSQRDGRPYDTLIITEAHKSLAQLIWNDTVRYLRHFHERMHGHNPSAQTFLFESWEGINDKANPEPWVALERDGSKLWSCVASRINMSLQHEGRADRVATIPVGAALAELIEAMGKGAMPSITAAAGKLAIDEILSDDVHLTHTGRYYVALLTYVVMTGQTVEGAWRPRSVPEPIALALQKFVWTFYQDRKKSFTPPDMAGCRRLLATSFCDAWNTYVPNKWVSRQGNCKVFFTRETMALDSHNAPNPFAFVPASDGAYWLPPP